MNKILAIQGAAYTDKGNARDNNEDNFYLGGSYKSDTAVTHMETEKTCLIQNDQDYFTCAVCDGVGGIEAGEEASLAAVQLLQQHDGVSFTGLFEAFFLEANRRICEMMERCRSGQMGTTAAVLAIQGDTAAVGNIGDSRVYRFRPETGELLRLTKDQTRAQQLIDAGVFTTEEMAGSRQNHVLTQYLGITEEEFIIEPDIFTGLQIQESDLFLLCSDGLSDMIKDGELQQLLQQNQEDSAAAICGKLGERALKNGGLDNITVVVLKVSAE